ncbi:LITAF-like zinc ribbon domain-containing protein [Diplogelasinospora grovesii]|uniref:LITAF-like zinc ribbon domain-containing protein n=1 Tax=Diplogelasinospora grovesii TaxID=303347 RepID=A0AAN6N0B2_9PEZI|nr:LITAF-like zinc ribbon domain-containing protein [Diplogelasinospora grovesii]
MDQKQGIQSPASPAPAYTPSQGAYPQQQQQYAQAGQQQQHQQYAQQQQYQQQMPQQQHQQQPQVVYQYSTATGQQQQQPAMQQVQQPIHGGQLAYQQQPVAPPGTVLVQQSFPMQAVQPVGGQPVYAMATPIAALNMGPAPVDCPACRQRAITTCTFVSGGTTHAWAALMCFFFCAGCIPYLMTGSKDVQHRCSRCQALLATWHRSGHTLVHMSG